MKKALSLLLALVLLLSLCACGNDNAQNTDPSTTPSQATTDSTEAPTDGTTEGTQAPTEEPTTAPTETPTTKPTETPATKPAETPSTKPTETPTTPPATPPATCSHSYKDATCTAPKTCTKCGATSGSALGHSYKDATCSVPKTCTKCSTTEGSALGHNYNNGVCTACGDVETITHPFGTGTGYAITVSSNGTEISCYQISCDEMYFTGYSTEKPAAGYYVFREYNGTTYYAPAPSWGWRSISSYTISGRTVELKNGSETMELELISANQYKVTKGVESIPAGIVFTFGTDMCSFMGHLYERSCENDVTCMYCGHFKCAGLGHEYGEDGVCFRCYAAMRPSN